MDMVRQNDLVKYVHFIPIQVISYQLERFKKITSIYKMVLILTIPPAGLPNSYGQAQPLSGLID